MNDILVERRWESPLTMADMQAMIEDSAACLKNHRCTWECSLLSADARDLLCHFRAPDAESIRMALYEAGSPRGSVWAGTIHDAPDFTPDALASANVVVSRRFDEPVDFDAIQALEDAGKGCLETHRVHFIRTYFSRDRKRMVCLYRAPDAESVRIAQKEADMPVERVWAVRRFAP